MSVQGIAVPAIGLGTWQMTGGTCVEAVRDALELGYRHLDTARAYGNEREVGRGLSQAGIDRGDVWVTTKLWYQELDAAGVRRQLEGSLRDLALDHVDLLLVHWPNPEVPLGETLGAMRELQEQGRAAHLGVSNFPSALLREAREHAPILADQVELHPYLAQPAVLEACREHDVMLTAYSPMAHGKVADDPVLREIGEAHGRTAGQVALRWLLDHPNVSAVPKSASHERRAQNLDVFGFSLTGDERARIASLARPGGRESDPSWAPEWD